MRRLKLFTNKGSSEPKRTKSYPFVRIITFLSDIKFISSFNGCLGQNICKKSNNIIFNCDIYFIIEILHCKKLQNSIKITVYFRCNKKILFWPVKLFYTLHSYTYSTSTWKLLSKRKIARPNTAMHQHHIGIHMTIKTEKSSERIPIQNI